MNNHSEFLEDTLSQKWIMYCTWIVAALAAAGVLTTAADAIKRYRKLVNVPVINLKGWAFEAARKDYLENFAELIEKGYQKYPDQVFQLWSPEGYLVIVPPRFVEEIRNLPEGHADLAAAVEERFVGTYKWTAFTSKINNRAVAQNLTSQLGNLVPRIAEEVDTCVEKYFPSPENDWVECEVYAAFLNTVAQSSNTIFVGPEVGQRQDYLQASIQYTQDAFIGSAKLRKWSLVLRPLIAKCLEETKRLRQHHALARRLLTPLIAKRTKAWKQGESKESNMIQWIMEQSQAESKAPSAGVQAELQMLIAMAGIHTTTLTATHAIFDLAARPEYIKPLREEIERVKAQAGEKLEKKDLARLVLLDSFIKESQRLNPPDMVTFDRVFHHSVTLSNGVHLPRTTRIAVPAGYQSRSPQVYDEPEKFDGFRFAKNDGKQALFVTTNPQAMHFGHGRHACPGRFFASAELKLMLVSILERYDIKLPGPRPANTTFGSMIMADTSAKVQFKARE